jgi:hypothetical protein
MNAILFRLMSQTIRLIALTDEKNLFKDIIFKIELLTVARDLRYLRRMKTQMLKGFALASLVSLTATPLCAQTPAPNQPAAEEGVIEEAGYGVGAALASFLYIPAKVTYAGLGLLTGGVGYVLSGGNADVANNIIYPAVRGNYIVSPSNLKGTDPIYFVGAPPPETSPRADAQSSATNATR